MTKQKYKELTVEELQDCVPALYVIREKRENSGALLLMRDHSYRMILKTGSLNFDMKSPIERERLSAIYGQFAETLETSNPIEISLHSKQLDMTPYIQKMQMSLRSRNTPEGLKPLIDEHQQQLQRLYHNKNLTINEHYITILWKTRQNNSRKNKKTDKIEVSDLDLATAYQQLDLRAENIEKYLNAMNIWTQRLDEEQLRLFMWELYHPGQMKVKV